MESVCWWTARLVVLVTKEWKTGMQNVEENNKLTVTFISSILLVQVVSRFVHNGLFLTLESLEFLREFFLVLCHSFVEQKSSEIEYHF